MRSISSLGARALLATALSFGFGLAHAQTAAPVSVEGAWTRATVAGQKAGGAFMRITAREPLQLVGAASPVAGHSEVHEMTMANDIMKMRAIPALDLPVGKAVELKPGGHHIMLMDLKAPIAKDATVPLTLLFKDAKGAEYRMDVQVPVATHAPGAQGAPAAPMHKH